MAASETPVEGSPAVSRSVAIGIIIAVIAVVAIVIVLLLLTGAFTIPTSGGT